MFGVVIFPGSNCDKDCFFVVKDVIGIPVEYLWHKDVLDLSKNGFSCIILPGGFSYGDYLRAGSIASISPIMNSIKKFVDEGGYVLGICNGFQILLESGILEGGLISNKNLL